MPKIAADERARRRQRFLDAAWRCVAVNGFRDMTIDAVCAEMGASKGAFYAYFDSKQTLLMGLLEDDAASLDRVIGDLGERELTPVERLRQFAKTMLDLGSDQARAQVRADLWAAAITDRLLCDRLAARSGAGAASCAHGWMRPKQRASWSTFRPTPLPQCFSPWAMASCCTQRSMRPAFAGRTSARCSTRSSQDSQPLEVDSPSTTRRAETASRPAEASLQLGAGPTSAQIAPVRGFRPHHVHCIRQSSDDPFARTTVPIQSCQ